MSGSLAHLPSRIIQQLLIDLGLGTDPSDGGSWPVYAVNQPDTPDSAITVYDTAGSMDGRSQIDGEVQEHEGVQVAVRDANPEDGGVKIDAVKIALDKTVYQDTVTVEDEVGTGSETYLVHSVSRRSGPLAAGKEPNSKRNLFTINAVVSLRQTS